MSVEDAIRETVSELSEAEETEVLDPQPEEDLGTDPEDEFVEEGTGAEASAGDDEDGISLDFSDIPEEYMPLIEEKLKSVEKYLHTTREKESSRLRDLERTAREYQSLIDNPAFREWVLSDGKKPDVREPETKSTGSQSTGRMQIFTPEGVDKAFDSTDGFADYLNSGMTKVLEEINKTLSKALGPIHQQSEDAQAKAEIAYMDQKYEGWRAYASDALDKITKVPGLTLEDAYKIVAGTPKEEKSARATLKLVRGTKKALIKNEPEPQDGLRGTDNGKLGTSLRSSILETIKELKSQEK